MFKFLLISIVIVPVILGIRAAMTRMGPRGLSVVYAGWAVFSILWVAMLYFLRGRWVG